MRRLNIIVFVFLIPLLVFGSSKPSLSLSTNIPYQGDVVRVTLLNAKVKSATFQKKSITLFPLNGALVAFLPISGTEVPGAYMLKLVLSDGSLVTRTIWVKPRAFARISLGIPSESTLTTTTLMDELQKEKIDLTTIVEKKTDTVYFSDGFQFPLLSYTKIASPFGEIRKTGSSIIRHWGIDYVTSKGSDVFSISGGVVAKSYFSTIYGNTVIIDHGQGIFSLYAHLNERLVNEGASVSKGEIIGRVGSTGYSFGPHLHLSMKANGVSVDPQKFITLMKN